MEKQNAIAALAALAQETRLDVFRLIREVLPWNLHQLEKRRGDGSHQVMLRLVLRTTRLGTERRDHQPGDPERVRE